MTELLKRHTIRESLPTYANALEYTIASQLLQHEQRRDLPGLEIHAWMIEDVLSATFFS
jgi:CHASE2 domain-containing sensor protein